MASQMQQILDRFTEQNAPLSLNRMAHDLAIDPGVLRGMIDYWVRKGKLREVTGTHEACPSCGVKESCPFVIALPRYYELVREGDAASSANPPCTCDGGCAR